jgi:polysaccharide export outer membrane protein
MIRPGWILLAVITLLPGCYSPAERAVRHQEVHAIPIAQRVELPLPPDEPPEIAKVYRLGYGDLLTIDDMSVPGTHREQVLVGPDGTISYLHLTAIPAVGHTLDELQADITERLKGLHRDPHPVLFLDPEGSRGHSVYVFGQVLNPGIIPYDHPLRVLDALAGVGGFQIDVRGNEAQQSVDLAHSVLLRGGQSLGVDFARLVEGGDLRHNVQLHPGDLIMIASLLDQNIYVLGAVARAGIVPKTAGMGTLGAIARAGGVKEQAWRSTIVVLRGSLAKPDVYILDFDKVLTGQITDLAVEDGDVVFVPERPTQYPRELVQVAINAFVSTLGVRAGADAAKGLGF